MRAWWKILITITVVTLSMAQVAWMSKYIDTTIQRPTTLESLDSASWIPGAPTAPCERSRLQSAYTTLFVKVVSEVGFQTSPFSNQSNECPFSSGMDVWSVLKYLNGTAALFNNDYMKPHPKVADEAPPFGNCASNREGESYQKHATAPVSQIETSLIERVKRMYSLYRDTILATYSTAP